MKNVVNFILGILFMLAALACVVFASNILHIILTIVLTLISVYFMGKVVWRQP